MTRHPILSGLARNPRRPRPVCCHLDAAVGRVGGDFPSLGATSARWW